MYPSKASTSLGSAVKFKKPSKFAFWGFSRFSAHGDIQAVFDSEPPTTVPEEIDDDAEQGPRDVVGTSHPAAENVRDDVAASPSQSRNVSGNNLNLSSKILSTKQLREMMEEAVGEGDIGKRLEELELSTKRIEALLIKMADNLDNPVTEETE